MSSIVAATWYREPCRPHKVVVPPSARPYPRSVRRTGRIVERIVNLSLLERLEEVVHIEIKRSISQVLVSKIVENAKEGARTR